MITGLVAATHTPFLADGSLNLDIIEKQAEHLLKNRVHYAFIGGTTGESASLTLEERKALAIRWLEVTQGTALKVIVHVGSNSLHDAAELARQASQLKAHAISALAPNYFKPANAIALAESMAFIAKTAPDLPFYYYEIPSMTGINILPSDFLNEAANRIPNLAGLKYTSNNLMDYQLCLQCHDSRYDIPFGFDEMLLAALGLGAKGTVGSSFNFAAPIYHRVIKAFQSNDLTLASEHQLRSVLLIQMLVKHGYMASAKAVMTMLGVDVGPPRLPFLPLAPESQKTLRQGLEQLGFFDWLRSPF